MAPAPQPFIWYDVMAPDMRLAEQFYAAALGWRAADAGVAGMEYDILFSGEQPVGGIMPAPPGFVLPPMWLRHTGGGHGWSMQKGCDRVSGHTAEPSDPESSAPGMSVKSTRRPFMALRDREKWRLASLALHMRVDSRSMSVRSSSTTEAPSAESCSMSMLHRRYSAAPS